MIGRSLIGVRVRRVSTLQKVAERVLLKPSYAYWRKWEDICTHRLCADTYQSVRDQRRVKAPSGPALQQGSNRSFA
jgi:hypothetical protein